MTDFMTNHSLKLLTIHDLQDTCRCCDSCIFRLRTGRKSIGRGILYNIDTWHRNLSDHGHILNNMIELRRFLLRDLASPVHRHDHFCRLKNHHSGINRSNKQSEQDTTYSRPQPKIANSCSNKSQETEKSDKEEPSPPFIAGNLIK